MKPKIVFGNRTFRQIAKETGISAKLLGQRYRANPGITYEQLISDEYFKQRRGQGMRKHGLSRHPLYAVWEDMKSRCYNLNDKRYKDYGGRGVTVCDEWINSPAAFIEWALENGWKTGLQIDKDIKGGNIYSPENCTIVTNKENMRHTKHNNKLLVKNKYRCLAELEEITGWSDSVIGYWIKNKGKEYAIQRLEETLNKQG